MKSVLGKFIQREFGKERYCCYADKLRKKESMDIFCDIYEKLQHKDSEMLNEALRELLETIQTSIRISKNFLYITMGCVVAILTLLFLALPVKILFSSLIAVSICYLYKLVEFFSNRYCDKDVKIVLIYKIALFHLLEESCLQREGHEI